MRILLEISLPLFGIILGGYLAGRTGLLTDKAALVLNSFVYYFALPALLFLAVATAPVNSMLNWSFLGLNVTGIVTVYALAMLIAKRAFGKDGPIVAVQGMVASYGNVGYLGVPLLIATFGREAALPAALVTLIYNVLIIAMFLILFGLLARPPMDGREDELGSMFEALRSVVINPIVLSVLVAGALAFLRVGLPTPVSRLMETLAGAAAPCALFAIGLALNGNERLLREGHIRTSEVSILVLLKLLIHPAIVAVLATYMFEMQTLWRDVAILMAALPVGVTSYVLAQRYAIYAEETASTILLSTALSVISVSALLAFQT